MPRGSRTPREKAHVTMSLDDVQWRAGDDDDGVDGTVLVKWVFNGRVVVGGTFSTAGDVVASGIARWDGAAWQSMGNGAGAGFSVTRVSALTVFEGALIAGGQFDTMDGVAAANIAQWDGAMWTQVGAG